MIKIFLKIKCYILFAVNTLILISCTTWVGDQKVSYEELCSRELAGWCGTNYCQHEENENYYRFKDSRLYVSVDKVHEYLGRVIVNGDYRRPLPMLDFESRNISFYKRELRKKLEEEPNSLLNYYFFAFDRKFEFDVISMTEIEASFKASLELILDLDTINPAILLNISNNIANKLNEASYTKGRFQILKLKPYIIDELRLMNGQDINHPLYSLWDHLKKNPEDKLVESIAVITSAGSISKARFSELQFIINSELSGLNLDNRLDIASDLTSEIVKTLNEKIEIDTKENASIFAFGLWNFN